MNFGVTGHEINNSIAPLKAVFNTFLVIVCAIVAVPSQSFMISKPLGILKFEPISPSNCVV
ncbi:MAG: hypothetical protein ACRCXT_00090 [Paraclostridium sp.]